MIKYKLQITIVLMQELIMEDDGAKTLFKNTEFYPDRLIVKIIRQTPNIINKIFSEQ